MNNIGKSPAPVQDLVVTNARIVLSDRVVEAGSIQVAGGRIADVSETPSSAAGAVDFEGDLLMPGLVELHTDNLERHMLPRPGAHWPAVSAFVAHDQQVSASGITTVFDAVAIGDVFSDGLRLKRLEDMITAIEHAKTHAMTKAEHLLHLRCEVSSPRLPELFEALFPSPSVKMISIMDHTPGQRQFTDISFYRDYYKRKHGMNEQQIEDFMKRRRREQAEHSAPNTRLVVERSRTREIPLASHDDATEAHVAEAKANGVTIAEFPTTVSAAKASKKAGMAILMGAPNLVRGGSHTGNVSTQELAEAGCLDVLSSDYAPVSLLQAAMMLPDLVPAFDLPAAIATVTKTPAEAAGLGDRGEIAAGRRADLIRVRTAPEHPVVRGAWRAGERIA